DQSQQRCRCRAKQKARKCRPAPDRQRLPAGISRDTQKSGVSEGQQAGISEQEVECAGKQRITHDLHEEYGIAAKLGQQGGHNDRDNVRYQLSTQDAFPNNPDGLSCCTTTMITNITVLATSGQKTFMNPSITPSP